MSWRDRNTAVVVAQKDERRVLWDMRHDGRFSPEAECGQKKRFVSKHEAERSIFIDENGDWKQLVAYECSWCGSFHLGHKPAMRSTRIRCAGCGKSWRPRTWFAKDGTVLRQRDADPLRCAACQPGEVTA